MDAKVLPPEIEKEEVHSLPEIPRLSVEDLIRRQQANPEMKEVIDYLESNSKPANLKFLSPAVTPWMRQWSRLELKNGLLYRKRMDRDIALNQKAFEELYLLVSMMTWVTLAWREPSIFSIPDFTGQRWLWMWTRKSKSASAVFVGRLTPRKPRPWLTFRPIGL